MDLILDILLSRYVVAVATGLLGWLILRDTLRAAFYIIDCARGQGGHRKPSSPPDGEPEAGSAETAT
jgi:hypothetical protein